MLAHEGLLLFDANWAHGRTALPLGGKDALCAPRRPLLLLYLAAVLPQEQAQRPYGGARSVGRVGERDGGGRGAVRRPSGSDA